MAVLMMAYRVTPHKSTGSTPNELMLGREVHMLIDIQVGQIPEEPGVMEHEYVENLRIRLENTYDLARENLGTSAVRKRGYYDMKAIDEPHRPGDLVC